MAMKGHIRHLVGIYSNSYLAVGLTLSVKIIVQSVNVDAIHFVL